LWVIESPEDRLRKTCSGTIEVVGASVLRIQGCAGPFCGSEAWTNTMAAPRALATSYFKPIQMPLTS
jgi:hypothetical protein